MRHPLPRLRAALTWLALLAMSALSACGPGVGGSGTGQGLDAFGASSSPLCSSDIASVLSCPAGTAAPGASASTGSGTGSGTVYFTDTVDGRRVLVTVQGNGIELSAPCAGISFRGDWGLLAGQAARFYGSTGEGSAARPAQLRASLDSGGLLLTLLDVNGNVLLGPVLVTVRPTAGTAGGC